MWFRISIDVLSFSQQLRVCVIWNSEGKQKFGRGNVFPGELIEWVRSHGRV